MLRDRLMVGHDPLEVGILVRIQVPELCGKYKAPPGCYWRGKKEGAKLSWNVDDIATRIRPVVLANAITPFLMFCGWRAKTTDG